jgi:serine/threonine protein kinase
VRRQRSNRGNLVTVGAAIPEELPSGFEFGGYVIDECIGRGGMARVYRAEHSTLHKSVALKVLDYWVLEKPGGRERFLREARTAAAIKHPSVVDIIDIGVLAERPYIVMELLDGCDLESELARRGLLSETETISLALPVIAGLIAVHEAGVVHRDVKPSNIFLAKGPDGELLPKVLDFGISKFSDTMLEPTHRLTNTREIVGTPTYMAPEALNGARGLGPRADQYSLGAVLYDCCAGRPPFEGATLLELLKTIAVGNLVAPRSIRPELSPELEAAILRAMSADPNDRFPTLRELGCALWPLADERTQSIWSRSFGPHANHGASGHTLSSGLSAGHTLSGYGGTTKTRPLVGPISMTQRGYVAAAPLRRNWVWLAAAVLVGSSSALIWRWTAPSSPLASSALPVDASPAGSRTLAANQPHATAAPGSSRTSPGAAPANAAPSGPAVVQRAEVPSREAAKPLEEPAARARRNRLRGTTAWVKVEKRATRRAGVAEASDQDNDLDQLFQPGGAGERAASGTDGDSELRAALPGSVAKSNTANGAPLPD